MNREIAVRRLLSEIPANELEAAGLAGEPLWLVHRLDVGTSSVVLLARDEETLESLGMSAALAGDWD